MDLTSSFAVQAPIEQVWQTLMDIERVAGCLPGAEVLGKTSPNAFQLGVKVKLGPVTMQYRGNLDVVERDHAGHRAVLSGQAKETRGQGTAKATATMRLTESDGTTRGTIDTQLSLSGKAAAMGKSVIGSVSDQLLRQFAANLQEMIDQERDRDAASTAAPTAEPTSAPTPPSAPAPTPSDEPIGAAIPDLAGDARDPSRETPPADDSLDGLELARGLLADQLADPRKVTGLMIATTVITAVIAYRLGRRSGRARRVG